MNHQETEVEQNPFPLRIPLHVRGPQSFFRELVLHLVGDGLALADVTSTGDQEVVGEGRSLAEVEQRQTHRLFFFGCADGHFHFFGNGTMLGHGFLAYNPVFFKYSATVAGRCPSALLGPYFVKERPAGASAARMSVPDTGSHTPD